MDFSERVDPELRAGLDLLPPDLLDLDDISRTRARFKEFFGSLPAPAAPGVRSKNLRVPGVRGGPDVPVRVSQPSPRPALLPALLWIHGGGCVLGDVGGDDATARQMVKSIDCLVVPVDYRLAAEHPFPAPLEDCDAALTWLAGLPGP